MLADLGKELIAYQMPEDITLGYLNEGPVGRDFNVWHYDLLFVMVLNYQILEIRL